MKQDEIKTNNYWMAIFGVVKKIAKNPEEEKAIESLLLKKISDLSVGAEKKLSPTQMLSQAMVFLKEKASRDNVVSLQEELYSTISKELKLESKEKIPIERELVKIQVKENKADSKIPSILEGGKNEKDNQNAEFSVNAQKPR